MQNISGVSLLDSTEQHQNIVTGHSYIKHELHNNIDVSVRYNIKLSAAA